MPPALFCPRFHSCPQCVRGCLNVKMARPASASPLLVASVTVQSGPLSHFSGREENGVLTTEERFLSPCQVYNGPYLIASPSLSGVSWFIFGWDKHQQLFPSKQRDLRVHARGSNTQCSVPPPVPFWRLRPPSPRCPGLACASLLVHGEVSSEQGH